MAALLGGATLAGATTDTLSPVIGKSVLVGADPDADVFDGRMWIYPTGDGNSLAGWSSDNGRAWRRHGPLVRLKDMAWIADGAPAHSLWAPDMVAANGRYYLYYAVGPQNPTPSRIGVASCAAPDGPCTDSGRALVTGGNGFEAIDPMVFVDPRSGRRLLYAGGSAGATLHVYELAPDMVTVTGEVPIQQPVGFTEGAFMHYRDGRYYLSYSAGRWNDASYQVRYSISPSPTGPWQYEGTILSGDQVYKGPGHHSFVQDPHDGSWLMVYHRWEHETGDGPFRDRRKVAIARVTYRPDGTIAPIDMEAR